MEDISFSMEDALLTQSTFVFRTARGPNALWEDRSLQANSEGNIWQIAAAHVQSSTAACAPPSRRVLRERSRSRSDPREVGESAGIRCSGGSQDSRGGEAIDVVSADDAMLGTAVGVLELQRARAAGNPCEGAAGALLHDDDIPAAQGAPVGAQRRQSALPVSVGGRTLNSNDGDGDCSAERQRSGMDGGQTSSLPGGPGHALAGKSVAAAQGVQCGVAARVSAADVGVWSFDADEDVEWERDVFAALAAGASSSSNDKGVLAQTVRTETPPLRAVAEQVSESSVAAMPQRPAWVLQCLCSATRMEGLSRLLSPTDTGNLARLPEGMRDAFLQAMVFTPQAWSNPSQYVQQVIPLLLPLAVELAAARAAQQMVPAVPRPLPKTFAVYFVSACSGCGAPWWRLRRALRHICKQFSDVQWSVAGALSYEVSADANLVACEVVKALPFKVHMRGCLSQWPDDAEQLAKNEGNRCFILLAGTECTDTSCANRGEIPEGKDPLHGSASRTWFLWHRGVTMLARRVGATRVAHIAELPKCRSESSEKTLNEMAGSPVFSDATSWGGAERKRYWRTSPLIQGPVNRKYLEFEDPRGSCSDGWVWAPTSRALSAGQFPVVLRAYWPTLVEKAYKYGKQGVWEEFNLQCLRVGKGQEIKYAGVPFFLKFLGMTNTPMAHVARIFICQGVVDNRDGLRPRTAAQEHTGQCGQKRHCASCSRALVVLGKAWHVGQATEVIIRTLQRAFASWSDQANPDVGFWPWTAEPHTCGADCPLAP